MKNWHISDWLIVIISILSGVVFALVIGIIIKGIMAWT